MLLITPFLILVPGLNMFLAAFGALRAFFRRPSDVLGWLILSPLALLCSILMGPPLVVALNAWLVRHGFTQWAELHWLLDFTRSVARPVGEWVNARVGTEFLDFAALESLPKNDRTGFHILVYFTMFVGLIAPFFGFRRVARRAVPQPIPVHIQLHHGSQAHPKVASPVAASKIPKAPSAIEMLMNTKPIKTP